MKFYKILTILLAFLVSSTLLGAEAETKKLYGITGAKLNKATSKATEKSYRVRNQTYTTVNQQAAKNYSKIGVASYYHSMFNGRKTSNGEIYNQRAFTAAHKTLPINSYAVVTNLRNNRKVIVRINDRGPFIGTRIIDLSKAAAAEIGMLSQGIAKVRVEALHVDHSGKISGAGVQTLAKSAKDTSRLVLNKTSNKSSNSKNTIAYSVRMKNMTNRKQAEDLVKKLAMRNVKTEIKKAGRNYEIRFSSIKNQKDVNQLKQKISRLDRSKSIQVYTYNH